MGRHRKSRGMLSKQLESSSLTASSVNQSTDRSNVPNNDDTPIDVDFDYTADSEPLDSQELNLLKKERMVYRVVSDGSVHIFLPTVINGRVPTSVQLAFHTVTLLTTVKELVITILHRSDICRVCSCNRAEKIINEALFDQGFPTTVSCVHVRAAQFRYPKDFEQDPSEIQPDVEVKLCEMPHLICSMPDDVPPSIVRVLQGGRMRCLGCKRETEGCRHIENLHANNARSTRRSRKEEADPSVDTAIPDELKHSLPIRFTGKTSFEVQTLEKCKHGNHFTNFNRQVTVVGYNGVLSRKQLTFQTTSGCQCKNEPVIHNDLQLAGRDYYVDCRLLVRVLATGLACQTPLSTLLKSLVLEADILGETTELVDIKHLTTAYDRFRDRLETKPSWFACQCCGPYPETIVVDGVTLGTRRHIDKAIKDKEAEEMRLVVPHKKRIFVSEKGVRVKMSQFAKKEMTVTQLLPHLPKEHHILASFLHACTDEQGQCAAACKDLVLDLASASSLVVVFPPRNDGHAQLEALTQGWNPYATASDMTHFMSTYPILHSALQHLNNSHGGIPDVTRQLLDLVCSKLHSLKRNYIWDYQDLPPTDNALDVFPGLPKLRDLPSYKNDDVLLDCDPKIQQGRRKLSHGLMLYLCPHGKAYGAQVLDTGESPRYIFEALMTRFPKERIPKQVIYDNSCRLAEYALSREYQLFSTTCFYVDRFHGTNHRGCAKAARLHSYKWSADLIEINSQCCEQKNSQLKYLRRNVSYMSQKTYTQTIKLYLAYTNCRLDL